MSNLICTNPQCASGVIHFFDSSIGRWRKRECTQCIYQMPILENQPNKMKTNSEGGYWSDSNVHPYTCPVCKGTFTTAHYCVGTKPISGAFPTDLGRPKKKDLSAIPSEQWFVGQHSHVSANYPVANSSTKPTRQSQTVLDAWERALFYLEDKNYGAVRKIILDVLTLLDEPTTKPETIGEKGFEEIFQEARYGSSLSNEYERIKIGIDAVAAEASRRARDEYIYSRAVELAAESMFKMNAEHAVACQNESVILEGKLDAAQKEISALRGELEKEKEIKLSLMAQLSSIVEKTHAK